MNYEQNILILSCGTRNKIVQYFKKELGARGQVMVTDCSELAPALYDADKHFIVPRMNDGGYLDTILSICKENKIKAILSLIDPELSLLAEHKQDFLDIGTIPILSDYEVVEMCFDKYLMYEFLIQNGFNTVRSYIDKDLFSLFINDVHQ
jgi:carbamoyl-phosphate synthase large subunit